MDTGTIAARRIESEGTSRSAHFGSVSRNLSVAAGKRSRRVAGGKPDMSKELEQAKGLVASLYKDEAGKPIHLTDSQAEIFLAISAKKDPRIHVMCFTRFGKSLTTALGVLTRASTYPEKWAIVAGTKEKAKIIMGYINAHIFDSEYTRQRFRLEYGDSAESIRRNRNKNHLSFDVGNNLLGEIFIVSAGDALGFGAPNVVEDEAALIPDKDHQLVMRMLGDKPDANFLCKIGNPFNRNHFLRSFEDPRYKKINVDCYQGVREGRITEDLIEENRGYTFFPILYENKFPRAEEIDEEGWSYLITVEDVEQAKARWNTAEHYGRKRLGNDVARGGRNFNVWMLRGDNYATLLKKNHEGDLMAVAGQNVSYCRELRIMARDVCIDDVGVGGGVTDRMREDGMNPTAVNEASKATELANRFNPKTGKEEPMPVYANMRAQLYAGKNGLANWIKRIGALDPAVDWSELTRIRYKKNGQGLTIIESKEDMRKRGEESPDVADSLALTFAAADGAIVRHEPPDPKEILDAASKHWDL